MRSIQKPFTSACKTLSFRYEKGRATLPRYLSCASCAKGNQCAGNKKTNGNQANRVREKKKIKVEFEDLASAQREAARCLQCIEKPCSKACPAGTNPDKFIRQLYFDNPEGAAETILNNNVLGGSCGILCPVSKLCEGACTRSKLDSNIEIGALQNFLHRYGLKQKIRQPAKLKQTGKRVAVIGSGPAGLAAARDLQRLGAQVTVFEARADNGGALRYFISPVRIEHDMVQTEVDRVKELGVRFENNQRITDLSTLENEFDKVFVAPGLQVGNRNEFDKVCEKLWTAIEILSSANTDKRLINEVVREKRVLIVGGGSVAMDAAVTCSWLGAKDVKMAMVEDIPKADIDEVELAREYNITFLTERELVSFDGTTAKIQNTKLPSEYDILLVDTIIVAIGQSLDDISDHLLNGKSSQGESLCGGDALNGGATVVEAIADGKKAAVKIANSLQIIDYKGSDINEIIPVNEPSLETEFCGVKFPNPFCLSSSPVSNTADMCARAFDAGWGGVYYKTLNLDNEFKILHPSPRLSAVHSMSQEERIGVGIQNVEQISDRPLKDNLKDIEWLKTKYPTNVVGVSIMGYCDQDWKTLAKAAQDHGADILELNFSCPQMVRSDAGHHVGQQFDLIERYTRAAKSVVSIPVIAKMTPNITDMVPAALAAQQGGADGISAINTLKSISHINFENSTDQQIYKPQPNISGSSAISGFSGHAGRPIALRFVAELAQDERLHIPISGMGGIYTWRDSVEFLSLGASNLQATTSVMRHGYRIVEDLIDGLKRHLIYTGKSSPGDIVGSSLKHIKDPSELDLSTESVSFINADKCIGCGACVLSCNDAGAQAIELINGIAKVDQNKCVGCNLCQHVCPVSGAVDMSIRQRINRPYL